MIVKGYIKCVDEWLTKGLYVLPNKDDDTSYKYDLFNRTNLSQFDKKFVSCRYAISNKPFNSLDDEEIFMYIHGIYQMEDREFYISDITSNSYYAGVIGGHDLFQELKSHNGMYIILEIKEVKKPSWMVDK